jgi:hypothetical protein
MGSQSISVSAQNGDTANDVDPQKLGLDSDISSFLV